MRTSIAALAVAGTASLLIASTAMAGVVVDPNGPASKQYSAGLDRARQQGSGSSGDAGVPGSSSVAPLFGAGVTPANSRARGRSDGQSGQGGQASQNTGAPSNPPALGAGSSTVLTIAAISVGVLLAGGMGAFAVRRGLAHRAG